MRRSPRGTAFRGRRVVTKRAMKRTRYANKTEGASLVPNSRGAYPATHRRGSDKLTWCFSMENDPTKLSDAVCKNAKPRERSYTPADGGGLHLLVKFNDARLWQYRATVPGKAILVSLGQTSPIPV